MVFFFFFLFSLALGLIDEKIDLLFVSTPCDGSIIISIKGEPWFFSESVFFRSNSQLYSSSDKSLLIKSCRKNIIGHDEMLGDFRTTEIFWQTKDNDVPFITIVKHYLKYDMVSFHQKWPLGAKNTSSNHLVCNREETEWIGCDWPEVISSFPSFVVGKQNDNSSRKGWLEFYGEHLNDESNPNHRGPRIGRWEKKSLLKGGLLAGPIAVFDETGTTAVISSMNKHMSASVEYEAEEGVLRYGVMGGVDSIPDQFEISFFMVVEASGINKGFEKWGKILLHIGEKSNQTFKKDPTCNYLGYQTDNGAFYYYHPSIGGNFLETLTAVIMTPANSTLETIPYYYVELDSWRYFKGPGSTGGEGVPIGGGLKNWSTDPLMFPGGDTGVQELKERTKLKGFLAHNRWFQNITDYAEENGGKWKFILEKDSNAYPGNAFALPIQEEFWSEILIEAKEKWGLLVYEQDWLWTQFLGMNATTRTVDLADRWLEQMDQGAKKTGTVIQYCMAIPRHVLASTSLHSVAQVRVSDDYGPGVRDQQWRIGRSSMLAWSLGLAAYKDGWMSVMEEFGGAFNGKEPYPELQSAVSAFSTGPVTPSDGVTQNNRDLIMRTCTKSGKLLHPSRSATAIDRSYIEEAITKFNRNSSFWPNRTEIWATFTAFEDETLFIHVLAADLQQQTLTIQLKEVDMTYSQLSRKFKYWATYRSWPSKDVKLHKFSEASFQFDKRSLPEFEIWHAVPVFEENGYGWSLLGEKEKWIGVSETRIERITKKNNGIELIVKGDIGEIVKLFFLNSNLNTMEPIEEVEVICDYSNSKLGLGKVNIPEKECLIF